MLSLKSTTSLHVIRAWSAEREGKPARLKNSMKKGGALLRIIFPGHEEDEPIEEIPWDIWYDTFLKSNLKFMYREKTEEGTESNLYRLAERED